MSGFNESKSCGRTPKPAANCDIHEVYKPLPSKNGQLAVEAMRKVLPNLQSCDSANSSTPVQIGHEARKKEARNVYAEERAIVRDVAYRKNSSTSFIAQSGSDECTCTPSASSSQAFVKSSSSPKSHSMEESKSQEKIIAKAPRTTMNADQRMNHAMSVISEMSEKLQLPRPIQDQAFTTFKALLDNKTLVLNKGNGEIQAATSLYIACRKEGAPRTLNEICAVSKVCRKKVGRCYINITKTLETSLDQITSTDFISRFCEKLGLPPYVQDAALHIAKKAVELDLLIGRSPITLAAAAIYLASQASANKKTPKEVSEIARVSESTIQRFYCLLLMKAAELFPDNFNFATSIDALPTK